MWRLLCMSLLSPLWVCSVGAASSTNNSNTPTWDRMTPPPTAGGDAKLFRLHCTRRRITRKKILLELVFPFFRHMMWRVSWTTYVRSNLPAAHTEKLNHRRLQVMFSIIMVCITFWWCSHLINSTRGLIILRYDSKLQIFTSMCKKHRSFHVYILLFLWFHPPCYLRPSFLSPFES